MAASITAMSKDDAPRIVNFINFVRDVEPRTYTGITQEILYETVVKQAEAIHAQGFKSTWLLQYDALVDPRYQAFMKEELAHGCEIGGWWEITEPHVKDAGWEWRGRFPWDWHSDKGFAVGYTPAEREKLVDVYMEKFHKIFGEYPKTIGSWFIDAHTLAYMQDRWGIEGSCMCRDQVGTDGYTLWGGYWHGAYYPSRQNSFMPAQSLDEQINIPMFRMLGSDPLWQYSAGVGGAIQSVCTMEPTYVNAQDPKWVAWYLRCFTDDPALGFGYFQAGQENSFGWPTVKDGFAVQMPQIKALSDQGKLCVETLIESCRRFRKQYPTTPATACTAMRDYSDQQGKTVWFNSRFYRTNILWEGDRLNIRDIHLFDERADEPYIKDVCISNQAIYKTLPLMDGCLWSKADDMASLRFYDADGKELHGLDPIVTCPTEQEMLIRWPLKEVKGEIEMLLTEHSMRIVCTNRRLAWHLALHTQPNAQLPFRRVTDRSILAEEDGRQYRVCFTAGSPSMVRGKELCIASENGVVEFVMDDRQLPAKAPTIGYDIVENHDKADTENWFLQTRHKYNNWPDNKVKVLEPLTLAVFSDIHGDRDNLSRYLQFCRHYASHIDGKYVIGDIVAGQYGDDFSYFSSMPGAEYIHIVIGNHDTNGGNGNWTKHHGKEAFDRYFGFGRQYWQSDPNVHQPEGADREGFCYYYVDYLKQGIRVVALDCMSIDEAQVAWLKAVLEDSRRQNLAVIALHHIPLGNITPEGSFNSCDYPVENDMSFCKPEGFLEAIDRFMDNGGRFLTWISGHTHYDGCGPLKDHPRQMTLTFENAHANDYWNDDTRRRGTKSQDSFNMLTFDLHSNCVKILRVGNDTDRMLTHKRQAVYQLSR